MSITTDEVVLATGVLLGVVTGTGDKVIGAPLTGVVVVVLLFPCFGGEMLAKFVGDLCRAL